jgi:hypothetical protein
MKPVYLYFTEHPKKVGMNYTQHFRFAMNLAFHTLKATLASVVHAVFPFLFTTTTSRTVIKLYQLLKSRLPEDSPEPASENPERVQKIA